MTNLSSRSDSFVMATMGIVVAISASAGAAIAEFAGSHGLTYGAIVLSAIGGVLSLIGLAKSKNAQSRAFAKIASVCQEVSGGNFEARITGIGKTGGLADAQHKINDMIGHCGALARDEHSPVIGRIASVCKEISNGNFEARITNISETGDLADVQYKVNDMIDRCDAFVREATASLDAVCRNIYYRRILLGGLNGEFRVAATKINDSVEEQRKLDVQRKALEKAQADAAVEQAQIIDWLSCGLKNLAVGDLTFRLADMSESYRAVKNEFNDAMTRLQGAMQATAGAAREVINAAAEISTSAADLSQRTEQQATGLEQTSASMEEISATVKKNAENAQQANQLTASTRQVAERGGEVVASTIEAMSRIEESSRKIADIIGVIDEIARQTNLLALNAAVEAARAGDAGRGFAVVASEVRSLAQRSSQAAKDIKDLITNSSSQVQEGVDLVNRAGTSLNEIVESIKSVATIVADIAHASGEQATGIDQVNKALVQMDEVTQQNSALVEESAATAKTLEEQSQAMAEQVGAFRLDQSPGGVVQKLANFAAKPAAHPAPAAKRGGIVSRTQAGLATALKKQDFESSSHRSA